MGVLEYSILAIVGVGAGFINVLAGGGSLLTVPAMVLMGVPGPVANGTNRIAIVAQAFTAILTFFRRGYYDLKLSASLAASLLPGAAIGAYFGTQIEGLMFNRLVAAIMIAVMIVSLTESRFKKNDQLIAPTLSPRQRQYLTHGLIALIGFYGGLIHIGIGFLIMPILHRVGGIDLVQVNMHKMAIILPYSLLALAIFSYESEILWIAGLALAVGNAFGGWLGAHVAITKGEPVIRIVFNLALSVLIVRLLFFN